MEIMEEFLSELEKLLKDLTGKLTQYHTETSGSETSVSSQWPAEIETCFEHSQDLTQQAQVEVRSLDSQERNEMNARLTKLKTAFANAKAEYGAIKNETAKSSLVGERSGKQRQRLVDTNQKIQKQNETILNATIERN